MFYCRSLELTHLAWLKLYIHWTTSFRFCSFLKMSITDLAFVFGYCPLLLLKHKLHEGRDWIGLVVCHVEWMSERWMNGHGGTDCLFVSLLAETFSPYSKEWNLWEGNFWSSPPQRERVLQASSCRESCYSWHSVFLYIFSFVPHKSPLLKEAVQAMLFHLLQRKQDHSN